MFRCDGKFEKFGGIEHSLTCAAKGNALPSSSASRMEGQRCHTPQHKRRSRLLGDSISCTLAFSLILVLCCREIGIFYMRPHHLCIDWFSYQLLLNFSTNWIHTLPFDFFISFFISLQFCLPIFAKSENQRPCRAALLFKLRFPITSVK